MRCDVTSRADVEAAVAAAAENGRLDVLVTCAGIIRDNLVHKLTDDDWESSWRRTCAAPSSRRRQRRPT